MRKFVISTVAAFAGLAFATAAQAEGDCGWSGKMASTPKPVVTADSGKTTQQTPIVTATKKGS